MKNYYYDFKGKNMNGKFRLLIGAVAVMSCMIMTWTKEIRAEEVTVTALLTEPILMNPCDNTVSVVWFTEEPGNDNTVILYENGSDKPATRQIPANTKLMSRLRGGKTEATRDDPSIRAMIYRHEAIVNKVPLYRGNNNEKIPYKVVSDIAESDIYSLHSKSQPGSDVRILLTSDLQGKPMSVANFTKAYETLQEVDAILANGDIVDVIDSAYYWFYADNAFFKVMTGKADYTLNGVTYKGGEFLQNTPIYAALGNHDYMGRFSTKNLLSEQFNDPAPDDYNRITWKEIFSMPRNDKMEENYYMTTIGDVGLITLDVNRPWRLSNLGIRGRYSELIGSTADIDGGGEFIFESVEKGSPQYNFFEKSLKSKCYQNSKYKMVMFHSPYSTLGGNGEHAFTNPVKSVVKDSVTGQDMTIFNYPLENDYIANNLVPLMEQEGVNLLFEAHTHIWNRFETQSGMKVLETSNVGNTYGGYYNGQDMRSGIPSAFVKNDARSNMAKYWDANDFALTDDLYGNEPEFPNIQALPGDKPYLSSDTITEFSVIDTKGGCVDSYYFDTEKPESEVVKFDSFELVSFLN